MKQEETTNRESNYCRKCWNDFTTLSEQEIANIKEIERIYNIKRVESFQSEIKTHKKYILYCFNNNKYYKNPLEASKELDISPVTIHRFLNGAIRKSKYMFEWREKENGRK